MHIPALRTTILSLGAVLLVAQTTASSAQEAKPDEEVTIDGSYAARDWSDVGAAYLQDVTRITISRPIQFGDLDLSKGWGTTLLQFRIKAAAQEVCAEIDRRYPRGVWVSLDDHSQCITTAARNALASVRQAVVASNPGNATALASLQ
jgi:UrcA family protein